MNESGRARKMLSARLATMALALGIWFWPVPEGLRPPGPSANLLFADSGFLTQSELYRLGAISTVFCLVVYVVVGIPWLRLVAW